MKHYILDRVCQFCKRKFGETHLAAPLEFPGKEHPKSHGVCPECHTAPQCGTCCFPLWYCGHGKTKPPGIGLELMKGCLDADYLRDTIKQLRDSLGGSSEEKNVGG